MVTDTSEKNLETILVSYLCDSQGYERVFQRIIARTMRSILNV